MRELGLFELDCHERACFSHAALSSAQSSACEWRQVGSVKANSALPTSTSSWLSLSLWGAGEAVTMCLKGSLESRPARSERCTCVERGAGAIVSACMQMPRGSARGASAAPSRSGSSGAHGRSLPQRRPCTRQRPRAHLHRPRARLHRPRAHLHSPRLRPTPAPSPAPSPAPRHGAARRAARSPHGGPFRPS